MTATIHLALTAMLAWAPASGSFASPREEARRGRPSDQAAPTEAVDSGAEQADIVMADGRRIRADRVLPVGDRLLVEWRRPDRDRDESAPFPEIVAILWESRGPIGEPSAEMTLQSGERFPGRLDRGAGELRWMHPWLGPIAIDLERVRSIEVEPGSRPDRSAREAESDRVRLANGDLIEGLVTELDRECAIESLADGSTRRVPLEVVARIDFLESAQPPGTIRLEARDGTVVDVDRFRTNPASLRETARRVGLETIAIVLEGDASAEGRSSREIELPLRDFSAILLDPARIVPLASIEAELEAIEGGDRPIRSWIPPAESSNEAAPLADRHVEFSGPARIRYRVAKGSVLSAMAVLPDTMRRFGDFELVMLDGNREVLRHRFSREAPRLAIAARIDSGELVLELREGRHGPVQDRLRLESPLLIAPVR